MEIRLRFNPEGVTVNYKGPKDELGQRQKDLSIIPAGKAQEKFEKALLKAMNESGLTETQAYQEILKRVNQTKVPAICW